MARWPRDRGAEQGDTQRNWFAVQTKTGRETAALLNLERQGYTAFLPMARRTVRHAHKITTKHTAFFSGYLFVSFDPDRDRWRAIDNTIGVIRLVKAGDRPIAAPRGLVETMIATTGADGALDFCAALAPGAKARLIQGPFVDELVVVERLSGAERVRVLLSMLNHVVPVEVDRTALQAV